MAFQQNGYALVPQTVTYDEWRQYALTHGVNVDWSYGNQCWDICALLWYQYGLRLETGNGLAYGCWTYRRDVNGRPPFELIYRKEDIKRGDVLVFNHHGSWSAGHICFADEDYTGSNYLHCLGQNQGQGTGYGTPSNVVNLSLDYFLGAFRNTHWESTPPPQPVIRKVKEKKFPWAIYTRKFRSGQR